MWTAPKSTETGAAGRGITTAAITALTAAIDAFAALINAPRSNIATRAALNRELTTRVAACMDHIRSMDDLVIQLTGTSASDFISGWQQARIIVDAGVGPGEDAPTPPAPPTPWIRVPASRSGEAGIASAGQKNGDRGMHPVILLSPFSCLQNRRSHALSPVSCLLIPPATHRAHL